MKLKYLALISLLASFILAGCGEPEEPAEPPPPPAEEAPVEPPEPPTVEEPGQEAEGDEKTQGTGEEAQDTTQQY